MRFSKMQFYSHTSPAAGVANQQIVSNLSTVGISIFPNYL